MINSSEALIKAAKEALHKMLTRQMEKGLQPSFYEMFYKGFSLGLSEGKVLNIEDIIKLYEWHYIEAEGNPSTDDSYLCLIQCDGYKDTVKGWYDESKDSWNLEWHPNCYHKVIAYHPFPQIPD